MNSKCDQARLDTVLKWKNTSDEGLITAEFCLEYRKTRKEKTIDTI